MSASQSHPSAFTVDITGAFDGYRLWLDGEPVGPTHPTFTRAVTAKAYLMADAHDALAQLAATLAKRNA